MKTEAVFRLLEVDKPIFCPANSFIRFLVTSADVIHSFSLPQLGIKIDAIPGRVNQICGGPFPVGIYYGQCSEICGVNHSFMPIQVEVF